MRRTVLAVVLLLTLLLVADRVTVHLAQRALAERAQVSGDLRARPMVHLKGFPFLTQAVRGRYDLVEVEGHDVTRGGVRVADFSATIRGAEVPLGRAIRGTVVSVPVRSLVASARVEYADIAVGSGLVGLRITPEGDHVLMTAQVTVLGQRVSATAVASVMLTSRSIALKARSIRALGQSSPALLNALARVFDLHVPLGGLPFGLHLSGLRVTPDGLVLSAVSGPTTLSVG